MENLLEVFRKIGQLSRENEAVLLAAIVRKAVPAKTILQQEGATSKAIYFVERGIARTYYYQDGKDITYWIGMENEFVGSMSSYFLQVPSTKYVETLEDCVLWEFEHAKLQALFSQNAALAQVGLQFAYYGISLLESRLDNLHFHPAKERYQQLLEKSPDLLQRVPLGMIASYLGISQETLSRIRKP